MDAVFFITTFCFLSDLRLALREARRVLREKGNCIVGLLPLDSPLGEVTHARADKDTFFKYAQLRTRSEVLQALEAAGFTIQQTRQTLFGSPEDFEAKVQSPRCGHDSGSFVVIRAAKGFQPSPSLEQRA
jgi:ubiquinone/menaquinone biosynthesis C-methylase UbiE